MKARLGQDKEKSRKTTQKMCLPLEGELKREDTKHLQKVPF